MEEMEYSPTSFLMRSRCFGKLCQQGHGLEFHSRISPSPSRSHHGHSSRRRRTSSLASRRRRLSFDSDCSSSSTEERTPPRPAPKAAAAAAAARTMLSSLSASSVVSARRQQLLQQQTRKSSETVVSSERTVHRMTRDVTATTITEATKMKGSPRLKAFDGFSWIFSPRTGYTYVDSATYRDNWTPDREVPMPHMARPPLSNYQGYSVAKKLNFSDNEDEEEDFIERRELSGRTKSNAGLREQKQSRIIILLTRTFCAISMFLRWSLYEVPAMATIADTFMLVKNKKTTTADLAVDEHYRMWLPSYSSLSSAMMASSSSAWKSVKLQASSACSSISRRLFCTSGQETRSQASLVPQAQNKAAALCIEVFEYIKVVTYRFINTSKTIPKIGVASKSQELIAHADKNKFGLIPYSSNELQIRNNEIGWMSWWFRPRNILFLAVLLFLTSQLWEMAADQKLKDFLLDIFTTFSTNVSSTMKVSEDLFWGTSTFIATSAKNTVLSAGELLSDPFTAWRDWEGVQAISTLLDSLYTMASTASMTAFSSIIHSGATALECLKQTSNLVTSYGLEWFVSLYDWCLAVGISFWESMEILLLRTHSCIWNSLGILTSGLTWLAFTLEETATSLGISFVHMIISISDLASIFVEFWFDCLIMIPSGFIASLPAYLTINSTSPAGTAPEDLESVIPARDQDGFMLRSAQLQAFIKSIAKEEMQSVQNEISSKIQTAKEDILKATFENNEDFIWNKQDTLQRKLYNELEAILHELKLDDKLSNERNSFTSESKMNLTTEDFIKRLDLINLTLSSWEDRLNYLESQRNSCCIQALQYHEEISTLIFSNSSFKAYLMSNFVHLTDKSQTLANMSTALKETLLPLLVKRFNTVISEEMIESNTSIPNPETHYLDEMVRRLVSSSLVQYDADKTGMFDYALETAGGSVVNTRCTETFTRRSAAYTLFGIPLWFPFNNPRTAIQPGVQPGECWAFKGSQGFLVIQLSQPMKPTQFSIEHIPKSLSPNGRIDSAPKKFAVYGLQFEKDPDPFLLGTYVYDDKGEPVQFFPVKNDLHSQTLFSFVELVINSNHGNLNYTCLYRFRVHGTNV